MKPKKELMQIRDKIRAVVEAANEPRKTRRIATIKQLSSEAMGEVNRVIDARPGFFKRIWGA